MSIPKGSLAEGRRGEGERERERVRDRERGREGGRRERERPEIIKEVAIILYAWLEHVDKIKYVFEVETEHIHEQIRSLLSTCTNPSSQHEKLYHTSTFICYMFLQFRDCNNYVGYLCLPCPGGRGQVGTALSLQ